MKLHENDDFLKVSAIFTLPKNFFPGMKQIQNNIFKVLAVFTVMFISSCAPRLIFKEDARARLTEQNVDLAKVQFYTDKEIILRRKVDSSEFSVDDGVIIEVDGRRTQEIKIPRYTPCIFEQYDNGRLYIRFDRGEDKLLRFKRNSYDSFQIDADAWIKRRGQIEYGGKDFYIEPGGNDALLLVKKTKAYKSFTDSEVTRGLKVKKRKRKIFKKRQQEMDEMIKDPVKTDSTGGDAWD
jgi:hypothetical protein